MITLLKAHRPERFSERHQHDHQVEGMQVTYNIIGVERHLSDEEIDRMEEARKGAIIDLDGNDITPESTQEQEKDGR
jgi:hypothetical protein